MQCHKIFNPKTIREICTITGRGSRKTKNESTKNKVFKKYLLRSSELHNYFYIDQMSLFMNCGYEHKNNGVTRELNKRVIENDLQMICEHLL